MKKKWKFFCETENHMFENTKKWNEVKEGRKKKRGVWGTPYNDSELQKEKVINGYRLGRRRLLIFFFLLLVVLLPVDQFNWLVSAMVVLETSPPLPAVGLYDLEKSNSGKMANKRFINLHSWLGPVCVKQMKESMVRSHTYFVLFVFY